MARPLSGQTSNSFTINPVSLASAGNYCVVVSGTCNSVTNCIDFERQCAHHHDDHHHQPDSLPGQQRFHCR